MPVDKVRPVEFERSEVLRGVTFYTADAGSTDRKTMIIGFSGLQHRLMAPTSWLLDCLNPMLYDVVVLRDFSKLTFARGIPGLGAEFLEAMTNLRSRVDMHAYRNVISLGTSGGAIPALLAALLLELNRGISICPEDFRRFASRLKTMGLDDEPYAALLTSRPRPFPELILVHGAERKEDAIAASFLHNLVPSHLSKVKNCAQHGVLIRDATPLRLHEIAEDPRSVGFPPGHPPMRSFLGVPILLRGVAYGNLYLTEKEGGGDFTTEDQELVMLLASQAAVAIENARLFESAKRWSDQLESLIEVGMEVRAWPVSSCSSPGKGTTPVVEIPVR